MNNDYLAATYGFRTTQFNNRVIYVRNSVNVYETKNGYTRSNLINNHFNNHKEYSTLTLALEGE